MFLLMLSVNWYAFECTAFVGGLQGNILKKRKKKEESCLKEGVEEKKIIVLCQFADQYCLSLAVFIIFPKSRNTFQYPLSKRVCKRLSKRLSWVVAFIIELYRELRVEKKALPLRSCIAQFDP